jgi:hypothetical protein
MDLADVSTQDLDEEKPETRHSCSGGSIFAANRHFSTGAAEGTCSVLPVHVSFFRRE